MNSTGGRFGRKFALFGGVPLGLCLLWVCGCGPSKTQKALAEMKARPHPGFFRVINLSDGTSVYHATKPDHKVNVEPGAHSPLMVIPAGSADERVDLPGGSPVELHLDVTSDSAQSYVVYDQAGKATGELVTGERVSAGKGETFVHSALVGASGDVIVSAKSELGVRPTPVTISKGKTGDMELPPGRVHFTARASGGGVASLDADLFSTGAFTVIVTKDAKGKPNLLLLPNNSRPMSVGASAAG